MKELLTALAIFCCMTLPGRAHACRDAYRTHEDRLKVSRVALVERVSSVSVPAIERDGYVDPSHFPEVVLTPRTIRLVVTRTLKGESPRVIELVAGNCSGSVYADIGKLLYVYKIHGEWRLAPGPPPYSEAIEGDASAISGAVGVVYR